MCGQENRVTALLDEMGIRYEITRHRAVYTISDTDALGLSHPGHIAKNLFLRDDKKSGYYLLMTRSDINTNLRELRAALKSRPLTFAGESDLQRFLGLSKGEVSPFGLLNDVAHSVRAVIDRQLLEYEFIGVHPNTNDATLWLTPKALISVIEKTGGAILFVDIANR